MMVLDGPDDVRMMSNKDIEDIILSVRCVMEDKPVAQVAQEEFDHATGRATELANIAQAQNIISTAELRQYVYRQALEERMFQLLFDNQEEIERLCAA